MPLNPVGGSGGNVAPNPHPGNDYYVNLFTGTIQRQSNPIAALALKASGWAGPLNWKQASDLSHNEPARSAGFKAAPNPYTPGIGAAMDVMHGLNLGNLLLRVGEVVLGIVLIGVGVAKITGAQNLVSQAVMTKIPV